LRLLLVLSLLVSAHLLGAQSSVTGSSSSLPDAPNARWSSVTSLRAGTNVWVNTGFHSTHCKFQQATDQDLTCDAHGSRKFAPSEIKAVSTPNRAESAAVLGAVGAGVGILVVQIVASTAFGDFSRGAARGGVYAGSAGLGALVFAPIGYAKGFMHRTVYRAP
jgi:hypothetical protein